MAHPDPNRFTCACVEGYSLLHYAAECVQDPQAAELVEEKADNTIYHNISFERGEHKESEKQKKHKSSISQDVFLSIDLLIFCFTISSFCL
jgi:hypothetical protein